MLDKIAIKIDSASDAGDIASIKDSLDNLNSISDLASSDSELAQINFLKPIVFLPFAILAAAINLATGNHLN